MAVTTRLMTAEEFWNWPYHEQFELIDGVLIETMPSGGKATAVAGAIVGLLFVYARPGRLGVTLTEPGVIIRRNPDTVRAPDAAFVRQERVPPGGIPDPFLDFTPDLIVEVMSPSNTLPEMQAKVREWLEAGARLVWVVYPARRTVEVIRSLFDRVTLSVEDTLDGGEVLPGFSCRVTELFE